MIDWLRKNKKYLSIRAIEKEIGCPTDTLQKFVNGRNLPEKWVKPLTKLIKALQKPYAGEEK